MLCHRFVGGAWAGRRRDKSCAFLHHSALSGTRGFIDDHQGAVSPGSAVRPVCAETEPGSRRGREAPVTDAGNGVERSVAESSADSPWSVGWHHAVLFHFVVQRDAADSQLASRLGTTETVVQQRLFDDVLFSQFDPIAQ